ncbi:MAG: hypothetical protein ABIH76_09360 [Candidatus Bathyarchaeota archaeon]
MMNLAVTISSKIPDMTSTLERALVIMAITGMAWTKIKSLARRRSKVRRIKVG